MASGSPPAMMNMPPVDQWQFESQGLGLSISMLIIATLSTIIRFYSRSIKRADLGPDDWIILPALLTYYGFVGTIIWQIKQGGFGIPPMYMLPPQLIALGKTFYVAPIWSVPTISFAKLSILLLYYKVFISPRFRFWTMIVGASVVLWMIACLLATALHCLPVESLWNPMIQGRCINFILFFEIIEPINCAQDIIIAVMPAFIIRRLQLDLKQKVSLMLIFLLGSLVAIISLIRIALVASPTAPPDALHTSNKWLVVQLAIAILCANMLTYRPLLPANLLPRRLSTWFSSLLSGSRSRDSSEPRSNLQYAQNAWPGTSHYSNIKGEGRKVSSSSSGDHELQNNNVIRVRSEVELV